ncbi:MAG TPA: hypothetical protein VMQ83_10760, partial [Gammaproteobacteria bacterium]|nr:hypothetical protein [Gammaproteobacteria bacterium]
MKSGIELEMMRMLKRVLDPENAQRGQADLASHTCAARVEVVGGKRADDEHGARELDRRETAAERRLDREHADRDEIEHQHD